MRSRLASIAAALLCLCSSMAFATAAGEAPFLPLGGLRLADNGDLVGWQVAGPGAKTTELIEPGRALVEFHLLAGDRDVRDLVAWRRLDPGPGALAEFVGVHAGLSLEIRRRYETGAGPGTIIHQVRLVPMGGTPAGGFRALVRVHPALDRHRVGDGSLGDYLYGYRRTFAAPDARGAFEAVREPVPAAAVALVVRHVAVIASLQSAGSGPLVADPESGATGTIGDGAPGLPHRLALGAVALKAGADGGGRQASFLYSDMWGPLQGLARLLESALEALARAFHGPGVAVVLLAVALRVILLPLNLWSVRQQRRFTAIQQRMKPIIERIEATREGADRSEEILRTYKAHGITPLSGLKGSASLLVQVPILIALFAVTTESAMFLDAPFLWAPDLSLPDRALALPFTIPGLGSHLNVLPLVLGAACVAAAAAQARQAGPGATASLRSGLVMALAFVVLFYSCAAALVLYWTTVILAQMAEAAYVARSARAP